MPSPGRQATSASTAALPPATLSPDLRRELPPLLDTLSAAERRTVVWRLLEHNPQLGIELGTNSGMKPHEICEGMLQPRFVLKHRSALQALSSYVQQLRGFCRGTEAEALDSFISGARVMSCYWEESSSTPGAHSAALSPAAAKAMTLVDTAAAHALAQKRFQGASSATSPTQHFTLADQLMSEISTLYTGLYYSDRAALALMRLVQQPAARGEAPGERIAARLSQAGWKAPELAPLFPVSPERIWSRADAERIVQSLGLPIEEAWGVLDRTPRVRILAPIYYNWRDLAAERLVEATIASLTARGTHPSEYAIHYDAGSERYRFEATLKPGAPIQAQLLESALAPLARGTLTGKLHGPIATVRRSHVQGNVEVTLPTLPPLPSGEERILFRQVTGALAGRIWRVTAGPDHSKLMIDDQGTMRESQPFRSIRDYSADHDMFVAEIIDPHGATRLLCYRGGQFQISDATRTVAFKQRYYTTDREGVTRCFVPAESATGIAVEWELLPHTQCREHAVRWTSLPLRHVNPNLFLERDPRSGGQRLILQQGERALKSPLYTSALHVQAIHDRLFFTQTGTHEAAYVLGEIVDEAFVEHAQFPHAPTIIGITKAGGVLVTITDGIERSALLLSGKDQTLLATGRDMTCGVEKGLGYVVWQQDAGCRAMILDSEQISRSKTYSRIERLPSPEGMFYFSCRNTDEGGITLLHLSSTGVEERAQLGKIHRTFSLGERFGMAFRIGSPNAGLDFIELEGSRGRPTTIVDVESTVLLAEDVPVIPRVTTAHAIVDKDGKQIIRRVAELLDSHEAPSHLDLLVRRGERAERYRVRPNPVTLTTEEKELLALAGLVRDGSREAVAEYMARRSAALGTPPPASPGVHLQAFHDALAADPSAFLDTLPASSPPEGVDAMHHLASMIFPRAAREEERAARRLFERGSADRRGQGVPFRDIPTTIVSKLRSFFAQLPKDLLGITGALRPTPRTPVYGGSTEMMGPNASQKLLKHTSRPAGFAIEGIYDSYDPSTFEWLSSTLPFSPPRLQATTRHRTVILRPTPGRYVLPSHVGATIVPESVVGLRRKQTPIPLVATRAAGLQLTVNVPNSAIEGIQYDEDIVPNAGIPSDISAAEYHAFRESLVREYGAAIVQPLIDRANGDALPPFMETFLQTVRSLPPREQLLRIEEFSRAIGSYATDLSEDQPLRSPLVQLREMVRLQEAARRKGVAPDREVRGVCAHFGRCFVPILLRELGYVSGVATGYHTEGSTTRQRDAHAISWVAWPGTTGECLLIPIDGTPDEDRPAWLGVHQPSDTLRDRVRVADEEREAELAEAEQVLNQEILRQREPPVDRAPEAIGLAHTELAQVARAFLAQRLDYEDMARMRRLCEALQFAPAEARLNERFLAAVIAAPTTIQPAARACGRDLVDLIQRTAAALHTDAEATGDASAGYSRLAAIVQAHRNDFGPEFLQQVRLAEITAQLLRRKAGR